MVVPNVMSVHLVTTGFLTVSHALAMNVELKQRLYPVKVDAIAKYFY